MRPVWIDGQILAPCLRETSPDFSLQATRLLPPSKMQGYAYLGLGNVLERRGKAEQAVQAFRASEKADPSSYKAVVSVGRLMQTMDHPQAEVA